MLQIFYRKEKCKANLQRLNGWFRRGKSASQNDLTHIKYDDRLFMIIYWIFVMQKKALILLLSVICLFSCSDSSLNTDSSPDMSKEVQIPAPEEPASPLTAADLAGIWVLDYGHSLGYEFRFYKNYRAVIILYLGNHALLFKGIYILEDGNRLRVNVSDMKRSSKVRNVSTSGGFVKAKSSWFLMKCAVSGEGKDRKLTVRPVQTVIDGSSSEGYLEPVLKLKKK